MPGNVRSKKAKNSELLAQRKEALFSRTLRTFPGNACSVFHNFLTFPLEGCLSTRVEPVHLLSALIQEHSGEYFNIENDSFLKESVSIPIWRMHANVQCRISNSEKC